MSTNSGIDFQRFIKTSNLIRLTSSKPPFIRKQGYVGAVFEDGFEFDEVTNPYEHFSNISDPPIYITHRINFADVEWITE